MQPSHGTSKGGTEEHDGEADLRVHDGRRPWITRGRHTRRATPYP